MTPINWQTAALHDLSPQTLYRLLALRSAVFVVEQTCCYLDPDGADLTALHVWAEQDGEIMACCVSCRRKTARHRRLSAG